MDQELSSPPTKIQSEDDRRDGWGYRSPLIAEKAQDLLGARCSKFDGICIGSHHKIYRVTMDDGRTVIGRILSPSFREYGAGVYPEDSMEAEIAAMRYVKSHTSIPVPEVYYHDKDKNGEVGGEWMILEDVKGTDLISIWWDLSVSQRRKVALATVDVWAQLMQLRLGAIGSINSPPNDKNSFYVGPMTFMPTTVGRTTAPPVPSQCGPFYCARDWLLALARDEMSFQRERTLSDEERSWMVPVVADVLAAPLAYLDNDERSASSPWSLNVFFHVDLGLHNIMVDSDDPTIITGVIDWEGACVAPLWSILPNCLNEIRDRTPETKFVELEEIRSLMKQALLEAVPDWAKLVVEGVEARMLHARVIGSLGNPKYALPSDYFF